MRLRLVALVVLACCALPAGALSISEIDANFSPLTVIGSAPPATYGGPSPIVQMFGASLPLQIDQTFFLEPILEFFGTYYAWTGSNGTAVPTTYEDGTGFFTVATLISLHAGASFPLSPALSLGGAIGFDFLLRFPFELQNTTSTNKDDQSRGLGYFFDKGRFFYPETRAFLRWHISDPIDLLINVRVFYPLFHAWDGLSQPFYDQLIVSGGLGFAFRLPQPK
jgi:hypothetical protein